MVPYALIRSGTHQGWSFSSDKSRQKLVLCNYSTCHASDYGAITQGGIIAGCPQPWWWSSGQLWVSLVAALQGWKLSCCGNSLGLQPIIVLQSREQRNMPSTKWLWSPWCWRSPWLWLHNLVRSYKYQWTQHLVLQHLGDQDQYGGLRTIHT